VTKSDLVDGVAAATGLGKRDAAAAVDAVFEKMQAALQSGDKIAISGFGTFDVRNRAARKGRNPQTGEAIEVAASRVPGFKAGKGLKDAVR
jgi:DNA-binding protein HU-beta